MFKEINGVLKYIGLKPMRLGGILPAINPDEAVNFDQFINSLGTSISETFQSQTNTTTLSHLPKSNRNIFVYVNSGSGYTISDPDNDFTISSKVITWTPPLEGIKVMVKYTY